MNERISGSIANPNRFHPNMYKDVLYQSYKSIKNLNVVLVISIFFPNHYIINLTFVPFS